MLAKVLMCECFYQIFESEGDSYTKKNISFFIASAKKQKKNMCFMFYLVTGILTVLIQIKKCPDKNVPVLFLHMMKFVDINNTIILT